MHKMYTFLLDVRDLKGYSQTGDGWRRRVLRELVAVPVQNAEPAAIACTKGPNLTDLKF